jgi:hypothetical protein
MLTKMGSADNSSGWRKFGTHFISIEKEDVLGMVFTGVFTAEDAKSMQSVWFEHRRLHGPYSFLADVSAITEISSAARKELVHIGEPYPFNHCFVIGASFGIRTLLEGVYIAGRVLRPSHFRWSMVVVGTIDDAFTRIESHKRQKKPL